MAADRDPAEDVLDYLARLDDHLEDGMGAGERKLVRKDVRRLLEDMAFRFAFLDGRLAPADEDTARALEALKPPERAARGLLPHRPRFRRRARKAAARSVATLLVLAGLVGGLALLAQGEEPVFLGEYDGGRGDRAAAVDVTNVEVPAGLDRVYLVVQPLVRSDGLVRVTVLGPKSEVLYQKEFTRQDTAYDDRNLPAPAGAWAVVVDYEDVTANVKVRLTGVAKVGG